MNILLIPILLTTLTSAFNTTQLVSFAGLGNTEGLDYNEGTFYVSTFYEGLWAVEREGDTWNIENMATFQGTINPAITAVRASDSHIAINCHDTYPNGTITKMNGRWKIPKNLRNGVCSTETNSPCEKLYPVNGEPISYIDGLISFRRYEFVSDPDYGDIWRYDKGGKDFSLWSGTNFNSTPNYLQGDPTVPYSVNNKGLGFGCNQLTVDKKGKILYTVVTDTCQVVGIPINKDGSAGEQFLVGGDLRGSFGCDGIFYDKYENRLLVTANIKFTEVFGMVYPTPGASIFVLDLGVSGALLTPLVEDAVLGWPADVVVVEMEGEKVIVSTDLDLSLSGTTGLKVSK